MYVLGIESSCDETSAAIVEDGISVLSNVTVTQIKSHRQYGGVVPELASRKHTESISLVLQECFGQANLSYQDVHAVAVSNQPGLFGSLIIGVTAAKTIAMILGVPLTGVNHVNGHIYANYLSSNVPPFPYICLIVSGGHTFVAYKESHDHMEILGRTKDDAAGEAYDKVARYLGIGYPGGPVIDRLAAEGNPAAFHFPRAMLNSGYDFSFSGLKTAVINQVASMTDDPFTLERQTVCDLVASFQESVVDVLTAKTLAAAEERGINRVTVAGGVAANKRLRAVLEERCDAEKVQLYIPEFKYCTDNAAMIASAGYFRLQQGHTDDLDMKIIPSYSS